VERYLRAIDNTTFPEINPEWETTDQATSARVLEKVGMTKEGFFDAGRVDQISGQIFRETIWFTRGFAAPARNDRSWPSPA
jgi:hypothetical protein